MPHTGPFILACFICMYICFAHYESAHIPTSLTSTIMTNLQLVVAPFKSLELSLIIATVWCNNFSSRPKTFWSPGRTFSGLGGKEQQERHFQLEAPKIT